MWKIQQTVKKGNYVYAVVPEHPKAIKYGYVLLHRVLMENFLGRMLNPGEIVHHKDGNGLNNDLSNLEVMQEKDHLRLHNKTGRTWVLLKCPNCGTEFEREKRNTHLSKNGKFTACSPTCRGKFSSKLQHSGLTIEVELAISGNVLKEFVKENSEETG